MPNYDDQAFSKHIVTPTEHEQDTIIMRRKLFKEQDQELARDWILVAQNCKRLRQHYEASRPHAALAKDTHFEQPFMSFPAKLLQRIESRFGPKWHREKEIKKKVWNMYPEFRLREKW